MKKEVSPVGIVIAIVVVLLLVGGFYYKLQMAPDGARPAGSTNAKGGKNLPTAAGLGGPSTGGKNLPSANTPTGAQ